MKGCISIIMLITLCVIFPWLIPLFILMWALG